MKKLLIFALAFVFPVAFASAETWMVYSNNTCIKYSNDELYTCHLNNIDNYDTDPNTAGVQSIQNGDTIILAGSSTEGIETSRTNLTVKICKWSVDHIKVTDGGSVTVKRTNGNDAICDMGENDYNVVSNNPVILSGASTLTLEDVKIKANGTGGFLFNTAGNSNLNIKGGKYSAGGIIPFKANGGTISVTGGEFDFPTLSTPLGLDGDVVFNFGSTTGAVVDTEDPVMIDGTNTALFDADDATFNYNNGTILSKGLLTNLTPRAGYVVDYAIYDKDGESYYQTILRRNNATYYMYDWNVDGDVTWYDVLQYAYYFVGDSYTKNLFNALPAAKKDQICGGRENCTKPAVADFNNAAYLSITQNY